MWCGGASKWLSKSAKYVLDCIISALFIKNNLMMWQFPVVIHISLSVLLCCNSASHQRRGMVVMIGTLVWSFRNDMDLSTSGGWMLNYILQLTVHVIVFGCICYLSHIVTQILAWGCIWTAFWMSSKVKFIGQGLCTQKAWTFSKNKESIILNHNTGVFQKSIAKILFDLISIMGPMYSIYCT